MLMWNNLLVRKNPFDSNIILTLENKTASIQGGDHVVFVLINARKSGAESLYNNILMESQRFTL